MLTACCGCGAGDRGGRGPAVGAGLALAACCDLVVATPDAVFGAPVARTLGNTLPPLVIARLQQRLGAGPHDGSPPDRRPDAVVRSRDRRLRHRGDRARGPRRAGRAAARGDLRQRAPDAGRRSRSSTAASSATAPSSTARTSWPRSTPAGISPRASRRSWRTRTSSGRADDRRRPPALLAGRGPEQPWRDDHHGAIARDYTPADLAAELARTGVTAQSSSSR